MDIRVGDILKLKKLHPCGSSSWEVLRIGQDFRLKCTGCGHQIMIKRTLAEKNLRGLERKAETGRKKEESEEDFFHRLILANQGNNRYNIFP